MCSFGVDYFSLIVLLVVPNDQGAFDSPNFGDDPNLIVLKYAECITLFVSFTFGVFLLFRKVITINCRSPPSISL